MQNILSKSYWNRQVPWSKKQSLLHFLATITLFLFTMMLVTPVILSDHHGDDGDPREEIVAGAGLLAAVAGGVAWAGAAAAGAATAPVWVPVAAGIGVGAGIVAAGVGLWDLLDGPEDDCNDCDGSGYYMDGTHRCPTCNPPDDDSCPNCPGPENGGGCSTCQPPEKPEIPDYTPDCPYCYSGCSGCPGAYDSYMSDYY